MIIHRVQEAHKVLCDCHPHYFPRLRPSQHFSRISLDV
jgi:hypothetical protein